MTLKEHLYSNRHKYEKCCRLWCNNEAYAISRSINSKGKHDDVCKEYFYNIYGIKVIDNKCSECGKEITGNAYVHSINYTERYCSKKCLADALGYRLAEDY